MIKKRDEIVNSLREIFGEDLTDDKISIIEDVTDTFSDYDSRINDTEDWKTKYEENDKQWRDRYIDRFSSTDPQQIDIGDKPKDKKQYNFENLFK